MVYEEFNSKQHEILTGVVTRIDPRTGNVSLRIGTGPESTEALLAAGEQVQGEELTEGMHVKVLSLIHIWTDGGAPKLSTEFRTPPLSLPPSGAGGRRAAQRRTGQERAGRSCIGPQFPPPSSAGRR